LTDAVIVSTARTPIGKAYRGAFNATPSPTLAAHAIRAAVERAGVDPAEIDDVIIGAAIQQGAQGFNVARQSALRAGLPDSVPAMSLDRQCSSGMMAIATAANVMRVPAIIRAAMSRPRSSVPNGCERLGDSIPSSKCCLAGSLSYTIGPRSAMTTRSNRKPAATTPARSRSSAANVGRKLLSVSVTSMGSP